MNYRLDAYGNLVNDGEDIPSIFNLPNDSRTPDRPVLPPYMQSPSPTAQQQNLNEPIYAATLDDWKRNGGMLIDEWETDGNRSLDEWENEGNRLMEEWKAVIATLQSAYFTPPTPPVLPTPPTFPCPPAITGNEFLQRDKDETIKAWRRRKEKICASWVSRKERVKSAWEIEKDKTKTLQRKRH